MDATESEKAFFEKRFDEIVGKSMFDDLTDVVGSDNCVTDKGRAFIHEAERRQLPRH